MTQRLLMAGSGFYLLAGLVMLVLPFEPSIVAGRVLQGAGAALVAPSAYAAIPVVAPKRAGTAMGIISTVGTAPLAIGPAVGLLLYTRGGSGWLLVPTMAMGAAGVLVALLLKMPLGDVGEPDARFQRQDTASASTDLATIGNKIQRRKSAAGTRSRRISSQPVVAALRASGFQWRWSPPLLASIANGVYFGAIVAYLPLFLAGIHGPNAGIFFTADAIGVVLLRWPAWMLADRTLPTVPMLIGVLLTLAGLAAFEPQTTVVWLALAGAGTGVGAGLFANGLLTEMMALSSRENRGAAMALTFAASTAGGFLGSSISGVLYGPIGFGGLIILGVIVEATAVPLLLADMWSGKHLP